MNLIEMATRAGLQVLLDARIGNQTYHSVSGSLAALERFADAVRATARTESVPHVRSAHGAKRSRKLRMRRRGALRAKPLRSLAGRCSTKTARRARPSRIARTVAVR
ncbi:hypothetical protein WKR88_13880 [Trinickia caryophylli]|uniref:Uncharacterized protein n=1 Tax=Trinickia caryophylli TaxID=28094 RepID=A0A1X7GMH8_TRICW|nr:hypothetical protein [Trinickia caryophylli]PMS09162.1 hypothetical protein C0Z17_26590 [Trinickia caryophylli]TRX15009.1 hypothetical protein FNF07_27785 [Trinickia caryophylli]WQE14864.1 hypothetical protein U0034_20115 [Trinickia caryophylli]SMF71939.1 hypothetical protein SAMN06295900_116156 [Trinickia caryophylli]GLU35072.1 hypothetical protein Busp01_49140 [Trinickia caryophylli]